MLPVLTPAEMGEADRRAIASGTPEAALIERAGTAVAWAVRVSLGGTYGRRAVVVCGKGNNGADGHVAARKLRAWGVGVDEFSLAGGIDRSQFERSLARADVAVDAMFGTGFRGTLDGDPAWIASMLADDPCLVVAVDIPSGVDGTTGFDHGISVDADVTVCFAALKPGLLFEPGRLRAGVVDVVDIGIPVTSNTHVFERDDVFMLAGQLRPPENHKWSSGLMVIGGSTGMIGAPMMTSHAAARCGAGMVVCGLPGHDAAARASGTEVVVRALPATDDGVLIEAAADAILEGAERFRAIAIGPGLGRDARTQRAVQRVVAEAPNQLVVDADGLNALAADPSALERRRAAGLPPAVLTPHEGEYERLAGLRLEPGYDRLEAARSLAERTGAVVLLKGPGTVVADPVGGECMINTTDIPALATAGTGDVLTGMIGGLLAAGVGARAGGNVRPEWAAAAGAWLHGTAARLAGTGDSLVASDLIAALPRTLSVLAGASEEE
ncbi:MAG: yjeF-like protein hydroxyethylthiazole kinaserelated [Actinomycetia bacterium]|nr:yjeF-like protein hydroxyethylthiazole kinaserelated [Actinomycetes bacterium]